MKKSQMDVDDDFWTYFNNMLDLVIIYDISGNILKVNKYFLKALGYKNKEEVIKHNIKEIILPSNDYQKKLSYSEFLKMISNPSEKKEFFLNGRKNKKILVKGYNIHLNNKNSELILNISNDISELRNLHNELNKATAKIEKLSNKIPEIHLWSLSQKKNHMEMIQKGGEMLRDTEKKYKKILENIKEGYFELDPDGKLIFFNKSLSDILEYPSEELLGIDVKTLIRETNYDSLESLIRDRVDKNLIELQFLKKNGKKIYIETSLSSKLNSSGELIGYFGIVRDITERKYVEFLKEKFREELEREVELRTHELKNALDQQKLFMNEILKASQFKSEFMATMSHELRTPLNSIIGFVDLLLEENYGRINKDQLNFLKDIKVSSIDLLELINHLLDISKIESGDFRLNLKKITLKPLIDQVNSIIKPLISEKNLYYKINNFNPNLEIVVDPLRFKEILYNLISNAIKFTLKGGITLNILETKKNYRFEIIDTGIGISKKDYNLIFKEFKRVDDPYVNSTPGTGLGLPLTKKLINLHGGDITFTSKYGKGSNFIITIPKD